MVSQCNQKVLGLIKSYQIDGCIDSRNSVVLSNIGLVHRVAVKYVEGSGLEYEDLIHEGVLGLIRAVDKYDIENGSAFTTYANSWIIQKIQNAVGLNSSPASVTYALFRDAEQFRRFIKNQSIQHKRLKDQVCEIALAFNKNPDYVSDCLTLKGIHTTSIDDLVSGNSVHPDFSLTESPDYVKSATVSRIKRSIHCLPDKQKAIMSSLYFDQDGPTTIASAAENMGIKKQSAHELHKKAVDSIKHSTL